MFSLLKLLKSTLSRHNVALSFYTVSMTKTIPWLKLKLQLDFIELVAAKLNAKQQFVYCSTSLYTLSKDFGLLESAGYHYETNGKFTKL